MTEEIWKNIEGYNRLYMVSNMGRVKSLNYHRTGKEKILKPVKQNNGYLTVTLCKNSEQKIFAVHRLVAEAFIDNQDNKPCIDHINAIRDDNRVENLRWCTYKENINNPISKKRILDNSPVVKFGKYNCNSKPVYQYSLDDKFIRKWNCIRDVERELGFDNGNISKCCLGKKQTCGGYKWRHV